MAPKKTTARVLALAERQYGVVSRGQLEREGMSADAVKHAIAVGRLHRVFHGVYALGRSKVGEQGRLMAATLVCGEGTVVSHRSAAALLGLLDRGPTSIDVISPSWGGKRIDGIHPHRVRPPRGDEVGTVDGIPCTSPARTFVDLAGTVGDRTQRGCFERAAARRLLDLDGIEASMTPGRPGMPSLRRLIAEWRPAAPIAKAQRLKSPLEAMVLPLLVKRGLPAPRCNAPVEIAGGLIEVDFLWAEQRFVVEADSRDFHATDAAFERDRWRDRELMRAGFSSLRVTRRQAECESEEVAEAICQRLATS